jgi:hypothetical protein
MPIIVARHFHGAVASFAPAPSKVASASATMAMVRMRLAGLTLMS